MMDRAVDQQNKTPDAMGRGRYGRQKSWKATQVDQSTR